MTARVSLGPLLRASAFRRLLTFLDQHRHRKPEVLTLDDLDAPVILAFLTTSKRTAPTAFSPAMRVWPP